MIPSCPTGPHTHSVTEVCALLGCDSEDWLVRRVYNGMFPGRRIVRQLRFSDDDIRGIIEACAVNPHVVVSAADIFVDRSRRDVAG